MTFDRAQLAEFINRAVNRHNPEQVKLANYVTLHRNEILPCVNALEGMNPAALGALIEAAEGVLAAHWRITAEPPQSHTALGRLEAALANFRGGAQ